VISIRWARRVRPFDKCIAPEGRFTGDRIRERSIPTLAINRVLLKNMSVVGVLWGGWVQSHPEYPAHAHGALMELFRAGKIGGGQRDLRVPTSSARMRDLAVGRCWGKRW